MKVMFSSRGVRIDFADGDRQVVKFGGCGVGARHPAACNGGIAGALESAAECPVILWDEVGSVPLLPRLASRS